MKFKKTGQTAKWVKIDSKFYPPHMNDTDSSIEPSKAYIGLMTLTVLGHPIKEAWIDAATLDELRGKAKATVGDWVTRIREVLDGI